LHKNWFLRWLIEGWNTGRAIAGNTEVLMLLHGHLEEARLAPVGTPRVSTNPVLFTGVGDAPPNNSDFMVDNWNEEEFLIDTGGIILELVSSVDTAGNWTVLVDFGLHLVLAREAVVMRSIILLVLNSPALVLAGLSSWAWWPGAVLALINSSAFLKIWVVIWIMGNVLLTGRVWDTLIVSKLVDTSWVSTLAATTGTTIDDDLSIKSNWCWVLISKHNVESISKR
jgi:hypothetical protein